MEVFLERKNFQLNKISKDLLAEIKKYCLEDSHNESCGIIYLQNDELKFLRCKNESAYPRGHFTINPIILIDYDVQYVVHSHTIGSARPSENDIKNSDELCIPYLIYSLRDDEFYLYENISV